MVVVWRELAGLSFEETDAALLDFWQNDALLKSWRQNNELETVYVNGDSTLGRELGAVELESLEQTFRELMFARAGRTN